ncbi:MAG TPA: peptidase [Candidatus Marinimicrobia bacterium]|nr:peptidase [Candidatus Neomarinimicrobiota bacterium]
MNFKRKSLALILILLIAGSTLLFGAFDVGDSYHGFKLIEKRFVKEVNAECLLFKHEQSGARLLKIAADDANKTFSIAFKTVPESDAGTPHIMEHSVLNGSKNFPVKSPFDVLAKGSLNTFLNAMTGSDVTIYPVASMNDKDYFNLMHVYLDAVFHPLIYDDPRILKQEGWHYELTDKDSSVVYKGVVFNEMKGAFSSPTTELDYQVGKHLFPDNCYYFSSGGYPSAIPTLSYEEFLNFHRKYYHPSNSYIYLYGNADLNKELAFINEAYLSEYQKSDAIATIPLQKPFEEMKEVTAYYSVPEDNPTENQTYLSLNFVAGLNTDRKLTFALDILSDVLVNQESAPIRLALQEAGIGREVSAYLDELKQNVFQINVQNANSEDKDRFRELVMNTLDETVKNGLDEEAVQATLNRIEFRLREGNDAQKGLTYNFHALSGWFHADDPFLSLAWEKPLAEVKAAIKKGYLEALIREYFLDNNHALLLVLEPKPGMEKENAAKTTCELEAYKATLSDEELDLLVQETRDLIAYQKRDDTPEALATIPMLDITDINTEAKWYEIERKKISKIPVLHYDTFTNNVVYVRLFYDAYVLPTELIPYAALLAEVMGSLNTENYTYGELDKALNMHTGGFSTYLSTFLKNLEDDNLLPNFIVSSKVMDTKIDKQFELLGEIVNHTLYNDPERLKAVLTRHQSRLDASIKRNGMNYALKRMRSYFSNQGMFNELTGGIEYYWFVTDLVNNYDEQAETITQKLAETAALLFTKDNLIVSVTCEKSDLPVFSKYFKEFVKTHPKSKAKAQDWTFEFEKKNEGLLSASKVQYVLQGYDFKKSGYTWDGKMLVLNQILSRDWLTSQIRIIGGAYGGFSSFSPSGFVYFGSYRDPNLKETLDNFKATPEYLRNFTSDETAMTRYIIGTIARIDHPLTPSQEGNLAVQYYFENISREDKQKERNAVLTTTADDIKNFEKMVSDILSQNIYCVYGNEEKIQANKELFKELIKLNR